LLAEKKIGGFDMRFKVYTISHFPRFEGEVEEIPETPKIVELVHQRKARAVAYVKQHTAKVFIIGYTDSELPSPYLQDKFTVTQTAKGLQVTPRKYGDILQIIEKILPPLVRPVHVYISNELNPDLYEEVGKVFTEEPDKIRDVLGHFCNRSYKNRLVLEIDNPYHDTGFSSNLTGMAHLIPEITKLLMHGEFRLAADICEALDLFKRAIDEAKMRGLRYVIVS